MSRFYICDGIKKKSLIVVERTQPCVNRITAHGWHRGAPWSARTAKSRDSIKHAHTTFSQTHNLIWNIVRTLVNAGQYLR